MALQGENIKFVIKGGDNIDLDTIDFIVSIYINPNVDSAVSIDKSQCDIQATNEYVCTIPYSTSKSLKTGLYTIEVLDDTNKTIFIKKNAFLLELSASKNLV